MARKTPSGQSIDSHYQAVLESPRGADFVKVDLHVHTPSSGDAQWRDRYDFKPEELKREECFRKAKQLADEIAQRCVKLGIRLIALTDHNTPGEIHPELTTTWHELVQSAGEKVGVCALPGVEISTNDLHILVILDPGKRPPRYAVRRINHLLHRCRFELEEYGDFRATGASSVYDVLEHIHDLREGALAIPAHIDGGNKALLKVHAKPSNVYEKLLNHPLMNAFEVVKDTTPTRKKIGSGSKARPLGEYFTSLRDATQAPLAWIQDSDGHSIKPSGLGKRFTYIRMRQPSFTALKNALEDPQTRVRLKCDYAPDESKTSILGMAFRKKRGKWSAIALNPNLNCIIGRKSTHKSTLLHLLLYGLNQLTDQDRTAEQALSPAEWLAKEGYAVDVFVKKAGQVVCFSRDGADAEPTRYQLRNGSFVKCDDGVAVTGLEVPRKYKHQIITDRVEKATYLSDFLDKYIFSRDRKVKALLEKRQRIWQTALGTDFTDTQAELTDLRRTCEMLYEARRKVQGCVARKLKSGRRSTGVELTLPQLGDKDNECLFKVRFRPGKYDGRQEQNYRDRAELHMRVAAKSYKRLANLPAGMRHAAYMILLMNQGTFGPLILDQPEQYLDTPAITKALVPRIRELKTRQQIICVTGDEHLLLNGDAEQVIVTLSEKQLEVATGDTNDSHIQQSILEIFEGDRDALRDKRRKLAAVLR